jgi:hypothetical protein
VTGDGRADVVLAQPTGGSSVRVTTCVTAGARFQPRTWWSGGWAYAAIQLAAGGDSTMILDELISTTNGENLGFVPTP